MKEQLKKYTSIFKKIWADERGKSLIKLGLYIVFIIFATLTASSTYKFYKTDEEETPVTSIYTMKNYKDLSEYSANYIIDDKTYFYTSVTKQIVKIDDNSYFIEDGNLVNTLDKSLEVPTFEFKFWYLTPSFIYDLIQNGEQSYVTTYADKSIETSYLVPLRYFAGSYDGTIFAIEDVSSLLDKNIEIVTTSADNNIVKVKINLSTYYVLLNKEITSYNIEIDYK